MESAQYPDIAQSVLDSEDPVDEVDLKMTAEKTKTEHVARASSTIQMDPIPISPVKDNNLPITNATGCAPVPHSNPVPPPAWNQIPGPNYWHPHFISASNPNQTPHDPPFPFIYNPQLMPQWGGQPGWGPPPVVVADQQLHLGEPPLHGFHGPARGFGPEMPVHPPFYPPNHFNDPQALPPAENRLQILVYPPGIMEPGMPVQPPFRPPSQSIDPHPLPSGDPPFAYVFPPVLFDQNLVDQSLRTPTKKLPPPKTPRKTPGKRKREGAEDTPSKKPTRASNRTRTPKKIFEID